MAFLKSYSTTYYSRVSGNWSLASTWSTVACGGAASAVRPGAADDVVICAGHTVTMNTDGAQCNSLTISGTATWSAARTTNVGAGGLLMNGGTITGSSTGFLNVAGAFTTLATNNIGRNNLTVSGSTTISSILNISSTTGTKIFTDLTVTGTFNNAANAAITINGNLVNNGTYTVGTGKVTFGGATNNTITGTSTTNFISLGINKGVSNANILDVQSLITLTNGGLSLTNGTLKLTNTSISITPFTIDITASPYLIPATAGLWCNGATVNSGNLNWSVAGLLRISAGTVNLGNTADNRFLAINGGTTQLTIDGGTFNVAGRISRSVATDNITFNMSAGTINVPTVSSTSATISPIMMDQAGSSFTMSGGTIVIRRAGGTNLGFLATAGAVGITGGTIQFGDAGTPAAQTMRMNCAFSIANLSVNSANATCQLATNLSVLQSITISSGTLNANNFNISLGNSWTDNGAFTPGTGTLTLNGTGTQTITKAAGETFNNLTINKASGTVSLANNVIVNTTLTMTAGNIDCGANTLTLGTSTVSTGTLSYTAGTVIGNFKRWINSTGVGILFPVGTSSYTRSVLLTFTNLVGGTLTANFVASDPGSNGLPLTESGFSITNQFTEGYWNMLAGNGLSSTNYSIDLTGNGFISHTITPPTRVLYRANSGNPWSLNGTHVDGSGNTCKRIAVNGVTAQFALGSLSCSAYSAVSISGSTSVCISTTQAYSVTNTPGNTYTWTILGGVVASGQGTSSINVNWGAAGMQGNVQVVEKNSCLVDNSALNLTVYISPITTSAITGATTVATNETGDVYSVTNTPGYTYTWSFPTGGGAIASGQGTNSVTINWGAVAGTYSVRVDATRLCGGSDFKTLSVVVKAPILSAASNRWGLGGTWVGGVVPTATDYVVIQAGHTVTMNGNPGACYKLTINGTASWTAANTTNVGAGGIIINSTGNITGSVAGILTSTGGLTLNSNSNITSTTVIIRLQTNPQNISSTGTPGSLNILDITTTATNTGILSIANGGTLSGAGTLIQGANSTLTMNGTAFTLTSLDATASGNSVEYGANAGQTIRAGTYHHLKCSTTGTSNTKTLSGALILNGNLTISGVTLDPSISNFALSLKGNWTNTGTFNPRNGMVTFNGSSPQTITNSAGETFNNLNMTGSGSKNLANNITINFDFTLSSTLNAGTNNVAIKGNWDNSGTYSGSGNTVSFINNTQLLGSTVSDFNNVTITGTLIGHATNMRVSGNWVNNGTFSHNNGTVTFNGTSAISGSAANTFKNLAITGTLTVPAGNLNIEGDYTNNGTLNHNNGTVIFSGSAAQTIGGSNVSSFKNITLNNAAGATLTKAQNVIGTLKLVSGTLSTASGQPFTLISDAAGTARIDAIPAGADITGNVTMQRYIPAGTNGWMFLSTPLVGATLQQWDDDFVTGGFPGSQYPPSPNASILTYDETVLGIYDNGYVNPANITDPIIANKGYWAYIMNAPITIDVTGTLIKGTQTFPVTYTDDPAQPASEDGWNLIANPFPSTIDWDAPGWTKTNVNDAVYLYSTTLDQYTSYVGGIGINGGSNLIASSQGFLIQTSGPSPVLKITENDKDVTDGLFIRAAQMSQTDDLLKLDLLGNGYSDETVIRFNSLATNGFDNDFDAQKFFSNNYVVPGIATMNDTLQMAINTLPLLTNDLSLPVKVIVGVSGTYTIKIDSLTHIASNSSCLILEDLLTGNQIDLRTTGNYSFYISDTTVFPRFLIHIGKSISVAAVSPVCHGSATGSISAKGVGSGPWNYIWSNSLGTQIQNHSSISGADTLFNVSGGLYTVVIGGNTSFCGNMISETIIVDEPSAINAQANVYNTSCSNSSDGEIVITSTDGGAYPYNYSWSNGMTGVDNNNLLNGTYSLTVSDSNNCAQLFVYTVLNNSLVVSDFNTNVDTVYLSSNSPVLFSNFSTGATAYSWNFGDGTLSDTSENPSHLYTSIGTYNVSLVVSDSTCQDSTVQQIIVVQNNPYGIISPSYNVLDFVSFTYNDNTIDLIFDSNSPIDISIEVYSVLGQKVFDQINQTVYKDKINLNFAGRSTGVYFIKIKSADKTITKKIVILK